MHNLTPSLQTAQHSASPHYGLSLFVEERASAFGTGGGPWAVYDAWPAGLTAAGWNAQSAAHDACAGNSGILRAFVNWNQGRLAVQWVPAAALASAAGWQNAPVVLVESFGGTGGIYAPKPALTWDGTRLTLFYGKPDGNLYARTSTDSGATWGAPATLYGGGDAFGPLFAAHSAASDLTVLQFARLSGGAIVGRNASRHTAGGVWRDWGDGGPGVPAGVVFTGATACALFTLDEAVHPAFATTLAHQAAALDAAGFLVSRSALAALWVCAGNGAAAPAYPAVGPGFGGSVFTCQDAAGGSAYFCYGALDPASGRLEEPKPLDGGALPNAPLERHAVPVAYGAWNFVVALGAAHRCDRAESRVTLSDQEIVAYTYSVGAAGAGGAGLLEMTLRRTGPGAAAALFDPGCALWLTRSCTQGADSGAAALGCRILRVEVAPEAVTLLAADALGILDAMHARRPRLLRGPDHTWAAALGLLAGWAGLGCTLDATIAAPCPTFQWHGGEPGLDALRRLLRGLPLRARSRVAASGAAPAVHLAPPDAAPAYAYGPGAHPIARRVALADARAPALAVVHGLRARNNPGEGEAWALHALAADDPNVRPRPLYTLNRALAGAELGAHAAAAAAQAGPAASLCGWLDAQANLALEPWDRITVEGEEFTVARIEERWAARRLVQRVWLARV